jgi:hypothetical protein
MAIVVTNSYGRINIKYLSNMLLTQYYLTNKSLKASTLTSSGLLLDRHDLQNLILESTSKEEIDDFKLLKIQSII